MDPSAPIVVKPRSRTVGVLLSALAWPGAGQVYLRRRGLGLLLMGLSGLALAVLTVAVVRAALTVVPPDAGVEPETVMALTKQVTALVGPIGFWMQALFAAAWVYGVGDALRGERR